MTTVSSFITSSKMIKVIVKVNVSSCLMCVRREASNYMYFISYYNKCMLTYKINILYVNIHCLYLYLNN